MTENEARAIVHEIAMNYAENGEEEYCESLDIAIKALEEVQRWHTSEINPEIKNVFANTSTQICHNCDHKDEYIVELEAEMEQYQTLEKRLTEMFGDQLSLETVVDEMERVLKEPGNPHPVNAKILTYEDAKVWEEYKAIGTPEELQDMKNNYFEALSDWRQYRKIGTLEECRVAVEKQTETLTVDEAKTIAAKAICIGCGYLAGCKCNYNGGNCMVSKPMLESVSKSFDDWNRRANDGKIE